MENSDFETILTVKAFDNCCTFYQGLLPDLKICVAASFMMKFKMQNGKILKIYAATPADNAPETAKTVFFELGSADIGHAIEYLLQHNLKFITDKNLIRSADPDGNTVILRSNDDYELKPVRSDSRTKKVKIS